MCVLCFGVVVCCAVSLCVVLVLVLVCNVWCVVYVVCVCGPVSVLEMGVVFGGVCDVFVFDCVWLCEHALLCDSMCCLRCVVGCRRYVGCCVVMTVQKRPEVLSTTDTFGNDRTNTAVTTASSVWVKPLSEEKTFHDTIVTFFQFVAAQTASSPQEEN